MSSSLVIPTVTEQDLLDFHVKTFGKPFKAAGSGCDDDYDVEEEDDELGYYPDGTKRTLTDEQIKIFRHSEIHKLLREKEIAQEAQELGPEEATKKHAGQPASPTASSIDLQIPEAEDDEAEYARFLEKERKAFADAAAKQREKLRQNLHDRTVSTRRRVREMDASTEVDHVLDY